MEKPFSQQLHEWLSQSGKKTLGQLNEVFGEKTFAVALLLLLFIPALPLPTGGISHVTEIIGVLLSLEMIIGLRTVWLPQKWLHKSLGEATTKKALPFIVRRVRWFEKFARPRFSGLLRNRLFGSFVGVCSLIFCLAAFLAPPFSGLDTLPSLGVVILSLGIILEDVVILLIGMAVGAAGVVVNIGLGAAIVRLFH